MARAPKPKNLSERAAVSPRRAQRADSGSLNVMHKLMAVLDCFSRYDRSLTLSEISTRCAMPKTTVHRLVSSLREAKLLEQDRGRESYRMGIRLFELGSIVLGNLDIYREARPLVERLKAASGEGSHLCVFDGTNMVNVEHREPSGESVDWTTTLSISPFAVMFMVFLWSLLWGLTGAFIGVPILVAVLTVCRQLPAMRWLSVMLAGAKG